MLPTAGCKGLRRVGLRLWEWSGLSLVVETNGRRVERRPSGGRGPARAVRPSGAERRPSGDRAAAERRPSRGHGQVVSLSPCRSWAEIGRPRGLSQICLALVAEHLDCLFLLFGQRDTATGFPPPQIFPGGTGSSLPGQDALCPYLSLGIERQRRARWAIEATAAVDRSKHP